MRSRLLKTTVLAVAAGAMWTQMPRVTLRWNSRWRLSLKCWFMGHEDWIRRTPERLYLECFECVRETQGWKQEDQASPRLVRSQSTQSLTPRRADQDDVTIAA